MDANNVLALSELFSLFRDGFYAIKILKVDKINHISFWNNSMNTKNVMKCLYEE